jgi:hypothetical protein
MEIRHVLEYEWDQTFYGAGADCVQAPSCKMGFERGAQAGPERGQRSQQAAKHQDRSTAKRRRGWDEQITANADDEHGYRREHVHPAQRFRAGNLAQRFQWVRVGTRWWRALRWSARRRCAVGMRRTTTAKGRREATAAIEKLRIQAGVNKHEDGEKGRHRLLDAERDRTDFQL